MNITNIPSFKEEERERRFVLARNSSIKAEEEYPKM